jgi:hypothetical protein
VGRVAHLRESRGASVDSQEPPHILNCHPRAIQSHCWRHSVDNGLALGCGGHELQMTNGHELSEADILSRFAAVARQEILQGHISPSCIASTWIAVEVLQRLGLKAHAREVVATVGNGAYATLWRRYGPPKTREQLDQWYRDFGADTTGIGHDQMPGGIGGHLIATIGDELVIDASLDQAACVMDDVRIPPVVIFPIDPRGLPNGITRYVSSVLFVEYVDRPVVGDYRASPDWGRTPEVQTAVERIVQHIVS